MKFVSYLGTSIAVANIVIPSSGEFEVTTEAAEHPVFVELQAKGAVAPEGAAPGEVDRTGWADPSDATAKPATTPADRREPEDPDDNGQPSTYKGAAAAGMAPVGQQSEDTGTQRTTPPIPAVPGATGPSDEKPTFNIPKPKKG